MTQHYFLLDVRLPSQIKPDLLMARLIQDLLHDIEPFLSGTCTDYPGFLEKIEVLQKTVLQNSISRQSTVYMALLKLWREVPPDMKENPDYKKGISILEGLIKELEINWDNLFKVKPPTDTEEGPAAKSFSYSKLQVDLKPGIYYGQWTDTTVTVINRQHKPVCTFQTEHKCLGADMRCTISVFPDKALVRSIGRGSI